MIEPPGAQTLIKMRLAGTKIDQPVLIVTGAFNVPAALSNWRITCKPQAYDWTCVKGLQAIAFVRMGVDGMRPFLEALAAGIAPGRASLWDPDRKAGAFLYRLPASVAGPPSRWPWEMEALAWTPWENEEFAALLEATC